MRADLPELRGPRVTLRRPVPADVDARLMLGVNKDIIEAYGGVFDPGRPLTRADAEAAIQFIEHQECAWVIDAGRFIGHIRLHAFAPQDRHAALAIGIDDPACLGKGYGTEAIKLVLKHAFETGLHRVSLRVLASNTRAIASYRKCGFVEEGREREAALASSGWQDDIIMGVLDREWTR